MPRTNTPAYRPWLMPGRTPVSERDFAAMNPRDAEAFVQEFIGRIPERVEQLRQLVRSSSDLRAWEPDMTERSLKPLGGWLLQIVKLRKRRPTDQLGRIKNQLPVGLMEKDLPIAQPTHEIVSSSYSPIMDVGIYVGEVIRAKDKRWVWHRCRSTPSVHGSNQPILTVGPKENYGYMPLLAARTVYAKILNGTAPEDEFARVARNYKKQFST